MQGAAAKAWLSVDDILKVLCERLPKLVDQLICVGKEPDGEATTKALGGLLGKLGG